MKVVVFLGPTLSVGDARSVLRATYRPPAAHGDVLRATEAGARAIGIIDGYFENVPAVWHKEILWAMAKGVHVFGAASMGALRAAELTDFGMIGIGKIYEGYHSGALVADDEVAIAHGPDESGYKPGSEALVNVRATLQAAHATGTLTQDGANALLASAKALFYPDRSYPTILEHASGAGLAAPELESFRRWLATGRVDQKRLDALALLGELKARLRKGLEPLRVHYPFEYTDAWHAALNATLGDKAQRSMLGTLEPKGTNERIDV